MISSQKLAALKGRKVNWDKAMRCSFSDRGRAARYGILAVGLFAALGGTLKADVFTNSVSQIQYAEKFFRKVRFINVGAFDRILLVDRGLFTITATLDLTGISFNEISEQTRLELEFTTEDAQFVTAISFGDDTEYNRGDNTVTVTRSARFGASQRPVESVAIVINQEKQRAKIEIHGRYFAAILAPEQIVEVAGSTSLAGTKLGQPSHRIIQGGDLIVRLVIASDRVVTSESGLVITGRMRRAIPHDRVIASFPAYRITLRGSRSRP